MATTNYTVSQITNAFAGSTLPTAVRTALITMLTSDASNGKDKVNDITATPHTLVRADITGNNLVINHSGGVQSLNTLVASDVTKLDGLIFSTNDAVNLTMNSGAGANAFHGWVVTNAGNDIINLSGAGVKVSTGDGNDSITSGSGNDSILSGTGNDTINAGNGNNTIDSGDGNDSITSGSGNDSILSGTGNDTINAGNGNNTIDSGDGNDSITVGSGNDSINTGLGNDTVTTGNGNDSINTGTGNDSITTGSGKDSITVGAGNDTVHTGAGTDKVILATGYTGNSILDGGTNPTGNVTTNGDTLDLRNVNIQHVAQSGSTLTITLTDASVLTVTNFENFIYDSNGTVAGGIITTVGVTPFVTHFP